MPRYFFHLCNSVGWVGDAEGEELESSNVARARAIRDIRSILSEEARNGILDLNGHVDIADETGTVVERVSFSDAITVRAEGEQ